MLSWVPGFLKDVSRVTVGIGSLGGRASFPAPRPPPSHKFVFGGKNNPEVKKPVFFENLKELCLSSISYPIVTLFLHKSNFQQN